GAQQKTLQGGEKPKHLASCGPVFISLSPLPEASFAARRFFCPAAGRNSNCQRRGDARAVSGQLVRPDRKNARTGRGGLHQPLAASSRQRRQRIFRRIRSVRSV